jgi:hypothetical protein
MEIVPNGVVIHVGDQAGAASRIAHVKFLVVLPPKPSPGAEAPEPLGPHLSLASLSAVNCGSAHGIFVGVNLRRISMEKES